MKNKTDRTYKRLTEKVPADKVVSVWMYVPVVVSLLVGLTLSLAAFAAVWQDESKEMKMAFAEAAKEQISAIDREMKPNLQFLEYLKAFYNGSEEVNRDEFKVFVEKPQQFSDCGLGSAGAGLRASRVGGGEVRSEHYYLSGSGTKPVDLCFGTGGILPCFVY